MSRVHRFDPDLPQITRRIEPLALGEFRADAVLGLADHSSHAEVLRGDRAVQLIACRVAFLNTHDAQGLCAIWSHVELCADLHDLADKRVAVSRRYSDLIGQLAAKRDAEQTRAQAAANSDIRTAHEGKRLIRQVRVGVHNLLQQRARVGACYGILRPCFGCLNQLHVHVWEQALAHEFHVPIDGQGVGSSCCDNEMILSQTRGSAIVLGDAIFAQHEAIAGFTDL